MVSPSCPEVHNATQVCTDSLRRWNLAVDGRCFRANTYYDVPFPTGLRDWFEVNPMIVTKDSPIFLQLGGMHLIHVNTKGLPTLKSGGPLPYPDGTIFADDVHEFSVKDGSYVEGNKKAIAVMVKDANKKYLTTGGWALQV